MGKTFRRLESKGKKAVFAVSPELCKGCGLCIEKCPSQVLDWSDIIGVYGTPIVEPKRMERCTGCRICQLLCPDAAIDIIRDNKKEQKEGEGAKGMTSAASK
ncbi:MAG TPA: 4Fe-4S dicluster domain-containing protein [Bacillota bacterium]|jgi:2-oxoglutarate ferredoxin oxidoreductase subunit delta|nr:4Fe-4S dicluster domain-containing protein [Bacillota bacterium]HOB87339.1 4Fe-4S dicluster domain-containing protein [Bacillota bacterium]HOP69634.1 4Fe-4S dicluster domain-containing protein [Bacillota bacterium]HPT33166.1 4Fe-4S dicluster domain-containing protein [Bacillota bacterium]HPZ65625.1 4Fe-4S dicluster domain-containing protein [Bacillota bacterium]